MYDLAPFESMQKTSKNIPHPNTLISVLIVFSLFWQWSSFYCLKKILSKFSTLLAIVIRVWVAINKGFVFFEWHKQKVDQIILINIIIFKKIISNIIFIVSIYHNDVQRSDHAPNFEHFMYTSKFWSNKTKSK